jgi:hypothetical protein
VTANSHAANRKQEGNAAGDLVLWILVKEQSSPSGPSHYASGLGSPGHPRQHPSDTAAKIRGFPKRDQRIVSTFGSLSVSLSALSEAA